MFPPGVLGVLHTDPAVVNSLAIEVLYTDVEEGEGGAEMR